MTRGRSIKHYLLTSWLIPALIAVAASAAMSLVVSRLDYSNRRNALKAHLQDDAQIIARRVAAELLLKENGRLNAVISQLSAEFKLNSLEVLQSPSRPHNFNSSLISLTEVVPGVLPQSYVHASIKGPDFSEFLNFRNFLFALAPITSLVLMGFFFQRRLLRRYIIRPIETLSETSLGTKPVKEHWPTEIQKIAADLAENFSNREQAIFGQLARGLIHDIRTQINSVHTALQLAREAKDSSAERLIRLEKLENACARNIPKLRELLELSLDSSRDIVIRPSSTDISRTLRQSIQNIQELADAKRVTITSRECESLSLEHDSLQLERVFTNLIKNAVEAIDEDTKSFRSVEISAESRDQALLIHIEDSGLGFPKEAQAFRPLKTTKARGHGLGLFVSRKIVEAHRGKILAERSARLNGARLTVSLPNGEARV